VKMRHRIVNIAGLFLAGAIVLCEVGCQECSVEREFNHPVRPSNTHRWNAFQDGSVTVVGDFVLGTGESVDNGKVGLRVVDLTSARCSLTREPETPTARIQFYNVGDQKLICESTFRPGNVLLNNSQMCGETFYWSAISVGAINAKENWVAIQLVK